MSEGQLLELPSGMILFAKRANALTGYGTSRRCCMESCTIWCVIFRRLRAGSLITCSQFSPAGWHAKLGEGAIVDSAIDRIVYRSDVIHIESGESMRKRIG